ncbi:MAG TPA: ATP synthase F1 subunit gamma [Spirochaetia bacterium]|nr:ATP synthase F1 subunit gamma [Spirochaetia bacterium]
MAKTRQIRKRIASVRNINKITRTMEKVAQSKVMKLNARYADAKAFRAALARLLPEALGAAPGSQRAQDALASQPLCAPWSKGSGVLLFVVTSTRGLCGGYNAKVIAATRARMDELAREGRQARLVVMGKKGQSYFRYHNQPVEISLSDIDENVPFLRLQAALQEIIVLYTARLVDSVEIVSTRYLTKVAQVVRVTRLLPFKLPSVAGVTGTGPATVRRGGGAEEALYLVEPSRSDVLSTLVPMAVAVELFCTVLEAMLGEQAERSIAMRSASDNADSMTRRLTRTYNRARQAQITSEMIEIISGSEGGRE